MLNNVIKAEINFFLDEDKLLSKDYKKFLKKSVGKEDNQKEIFNFYVINSWMKKNNIRL